MRKILQSIFVLFFVASTVLAQQRTITGVITGSDDGKPVPGVSIRIQGSQGGTQSNANGRFSIVLPAGATAIQFSSLGYASQTITVGTRTTINVVLDPDAQTLSDVVVVAYGTVKKEAYTGSASVVKSAVLADRPVTSFDKALQGAVSGVTVSSVSGQPGAASTVRIRGVGSLDASSQPLYVIDGIAINSGDYSNVAESSDILSTINPADIESLTVLKDASAAALYGSRGANGVIVITTKKGKNGATQFTASVTGGYQGIAVKKHETLGASDYFKLYFDSYYKSNIAAGQTPAAAATRSNASTIARLAINPFNTTTPFGIDGVLNPGASLYYDTDWRDEVINRGVTKDVNVSAQGGNEKTKFFISGGYFDQKGIVLSSDFKRYSTKINVSNQVNNWLNMGINTTLSYTDQNTPAGAGGGANPVRFGDLVANVHPLYQLDATGTPVKDLEGNLIYNYKNPIANDFNPVGIASKDLYKTQTARAIVNPYVEVNLLQNLKFKSNFGVDYLNNREQLYYNTEHGNGSNVKGRGERYSVQTLSLTITNTLNYTKRFGLHNLDILAGQEAFKDHYDFINAAATTYPFDGVPALGNASSPVTADSYYTDRRLSSLFSRVNYDFNNRYYLTGSLRYDGSSLFAKTHQYGTFYSVGAAWRITQEDFMKDLTWLNELKLRASYGTSGNDLFNNPVNPRYSRYASQGLYGLGNNYEGLPGMSYAQLPNVDLKWEANKQLDLGLEFSLFNSRVNAEISYFSRTGDGILYLLPLSRTTGFPSTQTNLASMNNRGFDIALNGDAVKNDNFSWNVSWNITTTKNKINSITNDRVIDGTKIIRTGSDRYQFYLREYAGVDPADGKPMWYIDGADGVKTTTKTWNNATRYENGSALPKFTGGLTNRFAYKQFDLSVFLFYSYGGKIYDSLYAALMHGGAVSGQSLSVDVYNSWKNPGDITNTPRFVPTNPDLGHNQSTRFLFDGSYIRVKNISVGYNLKSDWAKTVGLSNARLFVSAENAFTFAKHKGMDPETAITGLNDNDVPNVKSISLGLKIGF
ncbi:SusC/RagA family TonB-linked outer membrane protein [Pedobacter sp. AW31-3R]|uniref:SusC/RagA family TonB-linked outer membrane protein n=1 Tax=Pedobacter sp. AW31-3R TaxID=3445781 RepID=UPI003F9FEC4C